MNRKTYTNLLISQVGNSGYGKTITNQLKHRNVEYCSDAKASCKVNTQHTSVQKAGEHYQRHLRRLL